MKPLISPEEPADLRREKRRALLFKLAWPAAFIMLALGMIVILVILVLGNS